MAWESVVVIAYNIGVILVCKFLLNKLRPGSKLFAVRKGG
jgi:hypothetical protein